MHSNDRIVRRLARAEGSVLTVARLAEAGISADVVSARVRARYWQRPFRGVVVVHSGRLEWRELARAAVLAAGRGAALSHGSAGVVHGVAEARRTIVVSVPAERHVAPAPRLVIVRRAPMPPSAGALPTVTADHTVLDLLGTVRSDDDAVGLLTAGIRIGLTPESLLAAADGRGRLRHRGLLLELLAGPDPGIESPLERRYLKDVERAHDLPRSVAQVRDVVDGAWIRADRRYEEQRTRVELDGRLAHLGREAKNLWRDNAVLLTRRDITLRYRWTHVAGIPCRTAAQVIRGLRSGGWKGRPRRCGAACALPGP